MSNKTKKFVHGAVLLSIAGIATKLINMFFKVPLQAFIGDEGLAFYYNPYPIYTLFIAIFITGISSAMSKMVSEKLAYDRYEEAHTIFRYMLMILVVLGGLSSILLFGLTEFIVDIAGWDPGTIYALKGMAISPVILAVVGAIRGYFQGMQNMFPSAFAQIFESLGKVIFGIGLVMFLLSMGYDIAYAAGGAAIGLSIGVFLSMLFLVIVYGCKRKVILKKVKEDNSGNQIVFSQVFKSIFTIAIPIAIGAACYTMMNFIDSFTIVRELKHVGLDYAAANEMMGQKIKADTFINIPMVLSVSLVISILPAISEAVALKDKVQLKEKIDIATKLAYLIALPASIGIFILAKPLLQLFFFSDPSGAGVLAIYSLSILFVIIAQTYTAILQGIGNVYLPLINLGMVCAIKLFFNMMLINEALLVKGAVLSSVIAYGSLAILNYITVSKKTNYKINVSFLLKGLISTLVMGLLTYGTFYFIQRLTSIAILQIGMSVMVGVVVYGILIILTKALKEEDYYYIPQGERIYGIIDKIFYRGR